MALETALTFDDGPHPDGTGRLLELFHEHDVRATFFVWGEQASQHSEVLRNVLASGHSVQPHCWAHTSHWELDPAAIRADIEKVMALLHDLGAPRPNLWRPPYGRLLRGVTRAIAGERSLELVGWTIDPQDYGGRDAAMMYDDVAEHLAGQDARAVVLMHDGHREPGRLTRRRDTSNTYELARLLLDDGIHRFVTLSRGVEDGLSEGPS